MYVCETAPGHDLLVNVLCTFVYAHHVPRVENAAMRDGEGACLQDVAHHSQHSAVHGNVLGQIA